MRNFHPFTSKNNKIGSIPISSTEKARANALAFLLKKMETYISKIPNHEFLKAVYRNFCRLIVSPKIHPKTTNQYIYSLKIIRTSC